MKTSQKKEIGEVHFQHQLWLNQMDFFKEELKLFQARLEEIALKNTNKEVHISIEQFQNKFIIQRNAIDKINHLIHVNEDEAVSSAKIHLRRIDYEATSQYIDLKNEIEQFEKLYNELKKDFFQFLCRWM